MKPRSPLHTVIATSQNGAALVISLILLLVMSLLGITAIRGITMEERMAGQTYDRSLAFQATESALRDAEALLDPAPTDPAAGDTCSVVGSLMLCGKPTDGATPRWLDSAFTSWTSGSAVGSGTLAVTPEYFVEHLGSSFPCNPADLTNNLNCKRYRITARSKDNTGGRASVMLQSVYATD